MKILIDKRCFSSGKYLLIDNDSYLWENSNNVDHDLFFSLDSECSLNKYIELHGKEPINFIEKKYLRMMNSLNSRHPSWKYILPKEKYNKLVRKFQEDLKSSKDFFCKNRYSTHYSEGNEILKKLQRIQPDLEILNDLVSKETNPTLKGIYNSFLPEKDGFCKKVSYDRLKTVTGRLIVDSGPQVLLLPKKAKNILKSSYGKDGKIVWVDYVSLEPRFTKLLSSEEVPTDIYNDILESYSLNLSRKEVKLCVLAVLFGAGISKITEIAGKEAVLIKKAISDYFAFKDILRKAGDYSSGKITNHFGRPIKMKKTASNVAVNNFVQSSCVDVSLKGFSKLKLPKSSKPLAVIHDALVLDILKEDLQNLNSIIKKGLFIDTVGHFHLGVENL